MARVISTRYIEAEPGPPYKTAMQMAELCCEPTPELQCREKVMGVYNGPTDEEILANLGITLDANGRDQNGRRVRIQRTERTQPCGKIINRFKVKQKNCCDLVDDMTWNDSVSVEVLAPNSWGWVEFTGGRLPALVKVRGNGFTLDGYNTRDAWTYSRRFRLYASEFACGVCSITVDDGCSKITGYVRSTEGTWSLVLLQWAPVCFGKDGYFQGLGLVACSSYVAAQQTTYQSFIKKGYWIGQSHMNPGDIEFIQAERDSYICGLWGGEPGRYSPGAVIEVPVPNTPDLSFMALWGIGEGSCVPSAWSGYPTNYSFLFGNVKTINVYRWVC